jgi:hypothetical protein
LFKGGAPLERVATRSRRRCRRSRKPVSACKCRDQPASARIRRDVVLTCDHDEDIEFLVSHAKRALGVIRQNVTIALATKLPFLVFAIFGAAPLWLAVMADTGATVVVTLNGLRLLRAVS